MLKILFLTTSFPPYADSQTIRSLYLLREFSSQEVELTLLAPGTPKGELNISDLLPEGTLIAHTGPPIVTRLTEIMLSFPFGTKIAWLLKNVFYRVALPDLFAGWDGQAVGWVEKNMKNLPHVILSASGSPTAHIAASKLSKQYGIPWIADFGDPWFLIDRTHRFWASWWSRWAEPRTIANASHLIFTTELTQKAYQQWLGPRLPSNTVIPYGFSMDDVANISPPPAFECTKRIAHVGAAHKGDRNLIPLIHALKSIQELSCEDASWSFILAGNRSSVFDDEIKRIGLKEVSFYGRVEYSESLALMKESHVLVIVGNKGGLQVPGKVFMCLALARPLLYIRQCTSGHDEAETLLSNFGGIVYAENNRASLIEALQKLSSEYPRLLVEAQARLNDPLLLSLESKQLSNKYIEIINVVTSCNTM